MRLFIQIVCGTFWLQMGLSQSHVIDSLRRQLTLKVADTVTVNTYLRLGQELSGIELSRGLSFYDSAYSLSSQIDFSTGMIKSQVGKAHALLELAKYSEALLINETLLSTYEASGDSLGITNTLTDIGSIYLRQGDFDVALEVLYQAAEMVERLDNYDIIGTVNNTIGEVHVYSNDQENAKKYYLKALEAYNQTDNLYNKSIVLMNLGNVEEDVDKRLDYLRRSIQIAEEKGYERSLCYSYATLGDIYMMVTKELDRAIANYKIALKYATSSEDFRMINYNLLYLSDCWMELGQLDSANYYFSQIPKNDERIEKSLKWNLLYHEALIKHKGGAYELGFELLDSSFTTYQDYYSTELSRQVADANSKYESEKREAEITRQELLISRQENTRNILITSSIGIVAILTAVFFALYQRGKRRRRETELALQLEHERADGLEKLGTLKTDFFNNVSHELRTPLTLVIAPLEDALNKVRHVTLKNDLVLALNNSKRLLTLTNEILDLSKIDESKLEMEYGTIELISFLNRVYHAFDSLARTRGITLLDNLSTEPPTTVTTDINKLEKIITNLVSNALKYSGDGKEVTLELVEEELQNGRLVLHIKDNGRGIPREEQDSVFDRFYQSVGTQHSAGTGIGLALVKELTELMQGSIRVASKVGMGSTFSIDIPVDILEDHHIDSEVEQVSVIDTQQLPPLLIGDSRPAILIVEDDLEMSRYLVGLLEKNYACDTAYNGVQALEKLKLKKYDLISSDIMMPEMDGFEFRSKLNEDESLRLTPFIMLSARVLEEDKLRGFQLGIDDYITKPFSSSEFKARVYNLIKNKVSRSEVEETDDEQNTFKEDFISKAQSIVIDHIDEPQFKVKQLAAELNYSSRQLGRILQKMTGLTPVSFILEVRLQKAYRVIREQKYSTINEVRYEVGIESASYFSSKFKERFGINPRQLMS